MAFRTENNVASQLIAALAGAVSTDSMTILVARRQITDLDANTGELEVQGGPPSRIAGIVSTGNGSSFLGHTPIGTAWVARQTGVVESTLSVWTWRLIVGDPAGMSFFESPDDNQAGWIEFPFSPLEHTAFAITDFLLGSNGREAGVFDFAAIRMWDRPRDTAAMLAERLTEWALSSDGLILDKLGIGANLGAALAAGAGSMTTGGTVVLNADLPTTIIDPSPTVLPIITGTPKVGETLTVSDGEWPDVPSAGLIRPAMNAGYSTLSGYLQ